MESSDILFERRGAAGVVTLNRPKALNAVTYDMVCALARQLEAWKTDAAVTRVIIRAEGERAFSAGGDIRALYEQGRAGRQPEMLTFWRDEYPLNATIKRYPKPYVALIDGIVMGGGVGVSVHGSHRVAGDRFSFAMPEVASASSPTWARPGFSRACPASSVRGARSPATGSRPRTRLRPASRRITCARTASPI